MEYEVICEDGAKRHVEPFENKVLADRWANWGHCCTINHTFIPLDKEKK